ncbi:MAG TPA: ATP-binding protein [Polyangiaceae bacterium]|nr:ATP-binding protein [Polyangiaceae bacterium]
MDRHGVMTVVACAGDLAFGALAFARRSKSTLGLLLALLFLDAFGWNFASLAFELSRVSLWHAIDRAFSSVMPALALHVVVVFVGRSRSLRPLLVTTYAGFGVLGLFVQSSAWLPALAVLGPTTMLFALLLLLLHRQRSTTPDERARADLVSLAILIGTFFGVTELLYHEVNFPVPRLGAIGTLIAMMLLATAALRLRLLGSEVPPIVALYAFSFGVLWIIAQLALVRWLDPQTGSWVLGAGVLVLILVASAREVGRFASIGRARSQELAMLGRFSEQLAHDIKNPLAALKGAVQFLSEEHRLGRSLDEHVSFLKLIEQQIERVQRTIGDYQRIAKVEPRPTLTSLNAIIAELLALQHFAVLPGVTFEAKLAADLPECPLDRDLVMTALENVVRNACEAMPAGGTIHVRTAYERGRNRVAVLVEDEGGGMDARQLEQAAAPFFTTKALGTGLGLSFAERVARAHHGTLNLSSAVGRGTRVTLSFRVLAEEGA